ncbi:MAG: DUF2322 family protein [Gammaproteobacteria bacterium]|jgi:hypothetical protein
MPTFEENLKQLKQPSDTVATLEFYADGYEPEFVIENKPGSSGSLAVYYEVSVTHGGITPKAAEQALELFAEHTDDARANPGKHPNIDRLFKIIDEGLFYSVKAIPKS